MRALAQAFGVATEWIDWRQRSRSVALDTLEAVLGALGVDVTAPGGAEAALTAAAERPWRRPLAPATVLGENGGTVVVRLPAGLRVRAAVDLSDGRQLPVGEPDPPMETRSVDGRPLEARELHVPPLPLGYHWLRLEPWGTADPVEGLLIAAPDGCPTLSGLAPQWGWMVQLYGLRSAASWGTGDLRDLADFCHWSGRDLGAGFVLCNPLHAVTPVVPVQPSPYFPSSRRFTSPLYLRVEDLPEYHAAAPDVRDEVHRRAAAARRGNALSLIDRDAAWAEKLPALERCFEALPPHRRAQLERYRSTGGPSLERYARFCALAEVHGAPWQTWPDGLQDPDGPAVEAACAPLTNRIAFHAWLQLCADEQLSSAQAAAVQAGMPVGVLHDLAVGVDPGGADAWALQAELARGVTIGAPPDEFNQQGQDWQLPPLRPDRLADTGYAAFREMVATGLRRGGGLRIDHVLGLFRLWWVPDGKGPEAGAYVRYPADELLRVLALEAHLARDYSAAAFGPIVVGEDLGTVEPEVRSTLRRSGVLSSCLVYFERTPPDAPDAGRRLRPDEYPESALTTITNHDLPTVAAWWRGEGIRLQAELGLLRAETSSEEEFQRAAAARAEFRSLLRDLGFLGPDPDERELVEALHRFLAACRSQLVAASPADALGDRRQHNLPGTTDEHPNWRAALARPCEDGYVPACLDDLHSDPDLIRLAMVLSDRPSI